MIRLDRNQSLPQLQRVKRKAEYIVSVLLCIAIARAVGQLMDSNVLEGGMDQASRFYEIAVTLFVAIWAILGATGQYRKEFSRVLSFREVGRSGYLWGWTFFMSDTPVMTVEQEAQGKSAQQAVARAMKKNGFLSLKGRSRRAADDWLNMRFHPSLTEDERRCVPLWVSWVILRDNHCG